jgi:hypothetical protein
LVLLVHGFGGNPERMNFYHNFLTALNNNEWQIEKVDGLDPNYGVDSLAGPDANTKRIESFIEERTGKRISELPDKSLYLIGFSMGGLSCRQFSVWHPDKIAKVILIGTPNGGVNYFGSTADSSSWVGTYHMNNNSSAEPFQQSICWNCANKAKSGIGHYVFIGTCNGFPADIGEYLEGKPNINDGVVAEWSAKSIEKFKENDNVKIKFYYYNDGHIPGIPLGKKCESDLLSDSRIADKIIDILNNTE